MPMSLIRKIFLGALACGFAAAAAPLQAAELVEYYHEGLDHYFVTHHAAEIQALDSGVHKGWARTGLTIHTYDSTTGAGAGSTAVCRFYGNPAYGLDSHFYSASKAECDAVRQKWPDAWILETEEAFRVHTIDAAGACPAGTKAVYRLFNKRADINHRYTTDPAVFDAMVAKGYTPEGAGSPKPVVFCASNQGPAQPAAGVPLCTVTASTAFPVPGTPVTLTATCTETPTTYAWINCTSTGPTCVPNAVAPGIESYGVIGTNSRGSSPPANITLNWQAAASAGPLCTVTASNPTPTLGSSLTLTSSCSHTPTKFQWMACSALVIDACNTLSECSSSTTTCKPIGQLAGPVYYALVASNSAGSSQKAGVAVDWRTGGTSAPPTTPTSPTPFCSIAPSSTSPAVNTTLTLTASCTNNPTSYQWTNCTPVAGKSDQCTATEQGSVTRIYRVQGVNSSGVGTPTDITITWQNPPTAPPSCTLTPSSTTPYLGGTVTLTANCTQSPTSYTWTGCNGSGSTCQASSSSLGPASYSVRATNSLGTSAPANANVTWTTPPPSGADFCGQYQNVVRVNLTWGGHLDTHQNGNFPASAILVGRITVPQNATGTSPGVVSVVEYIDGQAQRTMTISPSSCDFRGFTPGQGGSVDPTGANRPMSWSYGINPNSQIGLLGMTGNFPKLEPGRTYYVNIRNRDYNGTDSCLTTNCNVRITVNRPR